MNLVFFAKSWPRRNFNAYLERNLSMLETFVNTCQEVTICSDDLINEHKEFIEEYPLTLHDINPKKVNSSMNGLKVKPNAFYFDSFETEQQYSAYLYNKWNRTPRVMDVNTLPLLEKWRRTNYQLVPNVLVPQNAKMAPDEIFSLEQLRSIYRCDYIITGNESIYQLLLRHVKPNKLSLINSGFPVQDYAVEVKNLQYRPHRNRKNFVFLGNLSKESSQNSIYLLINHIWPSIRKELPDVQLHIYGTGDGKAVKSKKEEQESMGIFFKGYLQNAEDLSKYRALLAPTQFSSGIKAKISQAFFSHLPVVTTPVGAQGMFLEQIDPKVSSPALESQVNTFSNERELTKEELSSSQKLRKYYQNGIFSSQIKSFNFGGSCDNFTATNFIQNAIKIYTDEAYWQQCLSNAQNTIMRNFNQFQIEKNVKSAFVKMEMAVFEGRGKGPYEQQWKRYTRSPEFHRKMKS